MGDKKTIQNFREKVKIINSCLKGKPGETIVIGLRGTPFKVKKFRKSVP